MAYGLKCIWRDHVIPVCFQSRLLVYLWCAITDSLSFLFSILYLWATGASRELLNLFLPHWVCACSIHTSTGTVIVCVFQKFLFKHSSTRDTYNKGHGYIIKKHAQLYTGDSFLIPGTATAAFWYQRKRFLKCDSLLHGDITRTIRQFDTFSNIMYSW